MKIKARLLGADGVDIEPRGGGGRQIATFDFFFFFDPVRPFCLGKSKSKFFLKLRVKLRKMTIQIFHFDFDWWLLSSSLADFWRVGPPPPSLGVQADPPPRKTAVPLEG